MAKRPALRTRSYSTWRLDVDYWRALSPADQQYLAAFLDDYYHAPTQDRKVAERDLVTISAAQASDLLRPTQRAYYTPDDYKEPEYAKSPSPRQGSGHRDD